MKALLIGGTGIISMAVTKLLAESDWEVYLLNRGNRSDEVPENIHQLIGDINDEEAIASLIKDMEFDAVCEFIGFEVEQIERDIRLFTGKTKQYIYISSASAYKKPVDHYIIDERVPLSNPYWQYSRNKKMCEERLMTEYNDNGFPITIVRPSHTYDNRSVPLGIHGKNGSFQVLKRMLEGKPVIIQGDGTSLWTMTHNSDFAKGYVGLMGNPDAIGTTFHITSDETLTWNQIYMAIADALDVECVPYHVASDFLASVSDYDLTGSLIGDKSNSVVFDNSRLKSAVPDYKPTVRFADGIKETIDYIMSHEELQVEDPEFDAWCDKVIETLEDAKKKLGAL